MRSFRFSMWLLCGGVALSVALTPTVSCFADGSAAADFNRAIQARAEQKRKAEQRKAEEARKAEQARKKQAEQKRKAEQRKAEEARKAAQARKAAPARQAEPERGRDEGTAPAPPPLQQVSLPTYTNSLGMEFVLAPAGSFRMGCTVDTGDNCYTNEVPLHTVTIDRPFYLSKYEVTQTQWDQIMGRNPSYLKGAVLPVERVSWDDVQEFIRRLNERERRAAGIYRLPTEAEWEYAARAGSDLAYPLGDDRLLPDYAWFSGNAGGRSHPVGQRRPNAWGLYDMHGNVGEWVQDTYAESYEEGARVTSARVYRGCSWNHSTFDCRPAFRRNARPNVHLDWLGFRLAMEPGS